LHAASQSTTFVAPAAVQIVIEPSPLHSASVPLHGGKQVLSTEEVDVVKSEQLALERASAQVPVTRIPENCTRQSEVVTACLHSEMSRLQSFSELIGRRKLAVPPLDDEDDVAPELLDVDPLDPVPG
jgi:hypothetical protein